MFDVTAEVCLVFVWCVLMMVCMCCHKGSWS